MFYLQYLVTCISLSCVPYCALQVKGVDKVVPALFAIWNEGASPFLATNVAKSLNPKMDVNDPDFVEGNLKHSINGLLYCNMEVRTSDQQ